MLPVRDALFLVTTCFICAPRPRPSVDSNYSGICLRASRPENYVRLGTLLTFVPACWPFEDDEILRQHTNLLYYSKGHRFDPAASVASTRRRSTRTVNS